MKPIVNINGTGKAQLVEQRLVVIKSIKNLQEALMAMKPHRCDYIGNVEQYNADREEWIMRFVMINKLHSSIEEEALLIHNS
jgi:hypothetical protein